MVQSKNQSFLRSLLTLFLSLNLAFIGTFAFHLKGEAALAHEFIKTERHAGNWPNLQKKDGQSYPLSRHPLSLRDAAQFMLDMPKETKLNKETIEILNGVFAHVDPAEINESLSEIDPKQLQEIITAIDEIKLQVADGDQVVLDELILASQAGQQYAAFLNAVGTVFLVVAISWLLFVEAEVNIFGATADFLRRR